MANALKIANGTDDAYGVVANSNHETSGVGILLEALSGIATVESCSVMSRSFAIAFASLAFIVSVLPGVIAGSDAAGTLYRALIMMIPFAATGYLFGFIFDQSVRASVEMSYRNRVSELVEKHSSQTERSDSS